MAGALAVLVVVSGCTSTTATSTPSPTPTPIAANFERYIGAYRTTEGVIFVINGHGHLLNLRDSTFRQLYPTASPDRVITGRAFAVPSPTEADLKFRMAGNRADQFTMRSAGGPTISADRLLFKETDVQVPVNGAVLAATITEPLTSAIHPGIVIVHGSGVGPRIDYGVWVGLYASLGMTVLAYDKRGNGKSTGSYPGEFPTEANLNIYAADAAAVLRHLASWPGVDPKRVGFHGGSQGGWTVPLAIHRFRAGAAFALFASGPAVSVDQQGSWASTAASSPTVPGLTPDLEAQLRAVPASTYDPGPALAAMQQPAVWYNGAADRTVPTELNAKILRSFHHANWNIEILPGVDHGLFENPSGLEQDELNATRLARGLWDRIGTWLRTNAGTPALGALDRDLDQRAVLHHDVDVAPIPVTRDALENLAALLRFGDFARGRGQILNHPTLQVDGELGIRLQVGEPATPRAARRAADIQATVDVVKDDLEAARLVTLAPDRGDIDDGLRSRQCLANPVLGWFSRCHRPVIGYVATSCSPPSSIAGTTAPRPDTRPPLSWVRRWAM